MNQRDNKLTPAKSKIDKLIKIAKRFPFKVVRRLLLKLSFFNLFPANEFPPNNSIVNVSSLLSERSMVFSARSFSKDFGAILPIRLSDMISVCKEIDLKKFLSKISVILLFDRSKKVNRGSSLEI